MALHLITGYAGTEHITSADQGAYNMGTYGEGEFVLDRGSKFAATVVSNNQITIANGEALMQGRFIKLPVGTTESVAIDNGASGMKRKDLIVLRYSKNSGTGVETATLAVKKGTPSSGTPSDPAVTTGNITDGTDLVNEMKLYRVNIDGLNITAVDTLFSTKYTMVGYMDNYQLPIATASRLGGVKQGTGVTINGSTGGLSVNPATNNALGGVIQGNGLAVDGNGVLSLVKATDAQLGGVRIGSGLNINDGVLSSVNDLVYKYSISLSGEFINNSARSGDWSYTSQEKTNFLTNYQGFVVSAQVTDGATSKVFYLPSFVVYGSPFTNKTGNSYYDTAKFGCFSDMGDRQSVVTSVSGSSVTTMDIICPKYGFEYMVSDNPSASKLKMAMRVCQKNKGSAATDITQVTLTLHFIPKAGG